MSAEKLADIESRYILGKTTDGAEFGTTPAAVPYIDLWNQNAIGNYIYRQVPIEPTTSWFSPDGPSAKLDKVTLPIVDGQQVTGKEIAVAAKRSKGKYTYNELLDVVLSPDPAMAMKELDARKKGVAQ